ncbi:MAG: hypothetical protein JKX79_00165, partial [Labilibaculum sp.]|nr:hypothetical protein [Labilibaculum sp.]
MKKILFFFLFVITISTNVQRILAQGTLPFNTGWYFTKVNQEFLKYGPKLVNADVSHWQNVDLPHDWSIEDLPNQTPGKVQGPFSKASIGTASTGWTVGGVGWYKKKFITETAWKDKYVSIHFDGVYM